MPEHHRGRAQRLPLENQAVTQLRVDFAFTLMIGAHTEIRIEPPFTWGSKGGERTLIDPERPEALAPLLLHQVPVSSATVSRRSGHLNLRFADGSSIDVAPHERYESYSIIADCDQVAGYSFFSIPGGGLM